MCLGLQSRTALKHKATSAFFSIGLSAIGPNQEEACIISIVVVPENANLRPVCESPWPQVGKTTTSLALISGLVKRFGRDRVGYIKPVGQQHETVQGHRIDKVRTESRIYQTDQMRPKRKDDIALTKMIPNRHVKTNSHVRPNRQGHFGTLHPDSGTFVCRIRHGTSATKSTW
jgi:hypothetical protein